MVKEMADHCITARNSTQRPSHERPQHTLQTVNNDTRVTDRDAFMCDVIDLNDDEEINVDRARPHLIMDGLPCNLMEALSSGQEKIETRTHCWHRWIECRGRAWVLEYAQERKRIRATTRGGNISGGGTIEDASGINWLRTGPERNTG